MSSSPGACLRLMIATTAITTTLLRGLLATATPPALPAALSRRYTALAFFHLTSHCSRMPDTCTVKQAPNILRRQGLTTANGHKDVVWGMHDKFADVPPNTSREVHNSKQADVFNDYAAFFAGEEATPPEVIPRLKEIVAAGQLTPASRVLDVGTGVGVLLPFFHEAGVAYPNMTGVDLSPGMLDIARKKYPEAHFWLGDIIDYPMDPDCEGKGYEAAFFNAVFGNIYDQSLALARTACVVERGGKIIISHPLGREFVEELRRRSPGVVLHSLPTKESLEDMTFYSPLQVEEVREEEDLYVASLKRLSYQPLQNILSMRGLVATGYGRGGKKLGVPTANLPESLFSGHLKEVPTGVYLGWAAIQVDETGAKPLEIRKAVVNVGYSPTFVGKENREKIVEAHLLGGSFGQDFYGKEMRLLLTGYQRQEKRFPSFPDLVAAIHQDIKDADHALSLPLFDEPRFKEIITSPGPPFEKLPFK